MIGLVLVTHGRLAAEFVAAMEHVVGAQPCVAAICIAADDDMELRRADIAAAVAQCNEGQGVIILTDMFGGTPSNLAISVMDGGSIEVVAGMNLPLLVKLAKARTERPLRDAVVEVRGPTMFGELVIAIVYLPTPHDPAVLEPLAEAIRAKYPNAALSVITNGSLLNAETNDWLDQMGFNVGISHDGPGQHVRGPDPLQDPEKRAAIMALYARLAPQGRISFNAMVNRSNVSRAAIQRFFVELTGDPMVPIGEGGFVDAYDEGGLAQSLQADELHGFRNLAFHEVRTGQAANVQAVRNRVASFVNSIRTGRPASRWLTPPNDVAFPHPGGCRR